MLTITRELKFFNSFPLLALARNIFCWGKKISPKCDQDSPLSSHHHLSELDTGYASTNIKNFSSVGEQNLGLDWGLRWNVEAIIPCWNPNKCLLIEYIQRNYPSHLLVFESDKIPSWQMVPSETTMPQDTSGPDVFPMYNKDYGFKYPFWRVLISIALTFLFFWFS